MIQRDCKLSKFNSFFLFGPRGSGKTSWLKQEFLGDNCLYLDLLDIELFDQLIMDSGRFKAIINSDENKNKIVIIDEIQKYPKLLDVVHSEIQKTKRQFILTGSSSRKLKQKGVNLLAGRAWVYYLYPFTSFELKEKFNLKKALERGLLPEAYLAYDDMTSREYLNAYVATYLEKEIQQEQWVKNLEPFRRFLSVAAQMNGKIINKSKIAKDVGVHDVTIAHYFEILEETLLGFTLPAFHESVRKAQKLAPKFYFIDMGIKRALEKTLTIEMLPQTSMWGDAFEHFLILEIKKMSNYGRYDWDFFYIRTKNNVEIDLIIVRPGQEKLLIEIKSKNKVTLEDASSLETLGVDLDRKAERWLISNDPLEQKFPHSKALHWEKALSILFPM